MNNDKTNYYNSRILEILLNCKYTTNNHIAEKIGLTEKTVRNRICVLENFLEENGFGRIEKKRRVGIKLDVTTSQKQSLQGLVAVSSNLSYIQDPTEQVDQTIKMLLTMSANNGLTMANLASNLYVCVPTATGILRQAASWLEHYGIGVNSIRNKGLQLETTEFNYRIAVKDFILGRAKTNDLTKALQDFFPGLDVESLRDILIKTENQWRLEFVECSFKEIWVYLCLSIYRKNSRLKMELESMPEEAEMLQKYNEYAFAKSIYEKVERIFNYTAAKEEIDFLVAQILCSNLLDGNMSDSKAQGVKEYDNKLRQFVRKIIETIGNVINVDLTDDEKLYEGLLLHIRPAIFRMRYRNSAQSETPLQYVKKDYKKVYCASWVTSIMFEEYYNVQITEDELIYITLYIQSAVERKKRPLKAVLVTNMGMGHTQFISEKIRKHIPQIECIRWVSAHDFRVSAHKDMDIIFAPEKHGIDDRRVVEIAPISLDASMQSIKERIDGILKDSLQNKETSGIYFHDLFDPELILKDVDITDKGGLIRMMTERLENKGFVTSKYHDSVLEREGATTTSVGNGVAIPHGNMLEVNESKVLIATLKNPILWHGDMVDVIFLLAVKMDSPHEIKRIQQFYKHFIYLTDSDEKVDRLRNLSSEADIYKYLIR
ncbi:BglG family transcription antiterminator [Anaerotalea alkaliphila]|uniref:PTS transporter subunit EIIA n=1 Tax=Anaerotalea alkaliphila TaxID=2662126 RepID=A0A7X5HWB3_9FIRM|nr:PTS sugar transporter subunit IIA [Anaerotalea alkaliphila]NDL67854.1 PTS transporter subunit EIIA [Anaerotalea alkaliphila]